MRFRKEGMLVLGKEAPDEHRTEQSQSYHVAGVRHNHVILLPTVFLVKKGVSFLFLIVFLVLAHHDFEGLVRKGQNSISQSLKGLNVPLPDGTWLYVVLTVQPQTDC